MQISKNFPQFNLNQSLIIVASKHAAVFYQAQQGALNKIHDFELKSQKYSDKEGFFQNSGKGQVFRTGSVLNDEHTRIKAEFLQKFEKQINNLKKNLKQSQHIFLFAPDYLMTSLEEKIHRVLQKKPNVSTFPGNFLKHHPNKLLKKINQQMDQKIKKARQS
ncbi:MAG: hypothetical protein GF332_02530 [Candidatus Moranbacteria bacterium]|nr:hypothetical protein [Candidatus Moranbacteria bacterium]